MPERNRINPLFTVSLRYGLIASVAGMASVVAFFYMGKHPFWIFPLFDIRILVISILLFFSLKEIRDYFFGGLLFFWQGIAGSIIFILVMALLGFAGIYGFGSLEDSFVSEYVRQGLEQINALSDASAAQIGKPAVEEMKKTLPETSLAWMAKRYAIQTLTFGLFICVIISVVLRKHNQQTP
ncbi:MAG: DUF4199 domain-containing protein [Bacteroidetes bacterium]|nr:DUF4199 domain-containing protein [Bacteroidota bacterium]